jgi:hypothetical protein
MRRLPTAVLIAGITAIGVLSAGCSSSGGSPHASTSKSVGRSHSRQPSSATHSNGPTAPPAVRSAISKAYAALFGTKSTLAQSVDSLQNGQAFKQAIVAESKKPAAKGSDAKVTAVTMQSANVAKVTFTVYSNGQPALPGASGLAVRQGGKWKVAAQTFCQLLTLQGDAPHACNNPKITVVPH